MHLHEGKMLLIIFSIAVQLIQTVVHEILHTLSIEHEQSWPDRDDYITIDCSNIAEGGSSQFYKVSR